jgi:hypothetical protein
MRQVHTVAGATLVALMLAALSGCGCSYGSASPATTSPPTSCLVLRPGVSCVGVGNLEIENRCAEALTVSSPSGRPAVTLQPGQSGTVGIGAYAVEVEDGATCVATFTVQATLGATPILIEFTAEMVNRGAFSC